MNKVVLLMSGGYDSTTCLALLEHLGYEGICLFFDYGQVSVLKERECAQFNTWEYGKGKFEFKEVGIGADWLYNSDADGYFPSRNVIFLSYALSLAEATDRSIIVIGTMKVDSYYPDTSPQFISSFNEIADTVDKVVWSPLQHMTKPMVYNLGSTLGVRFEDTWSCDEPEEDGSPCGKCGACMDIQRGKKEGLI